MSMRFTSFPREFVKAIFGTTTSGEEKEISVDSESGSLISIPLEHWMIHRGLHFFYKSVVSVPAGAGTGIVEVIFVVPEESEGYEIHPKFLYEPKAEVLIELFEDATVSATGTQIQTFNCNRNSSNTPLLKTYSGPTVTNDGTKLWEDLGGEGKNSAGITPGLNYEIPAKHGSTYLFRITNQTSKSASVNFDTFWYEIPEND